MKATPRIVIAGAGFAGIYTLRRLLKKLKQDEAEITIIDQRNYFLFTPLLHEVATCSIDQTQPVESISYFLQNSKTKFLIDEIKGIDLDGKKVLTGKQDVPFDYLVMGLGAKTNHYGIPGAKEYTWPVKDLSDAIKLREHLISTFQQ